MDTKPHAIQPQSSEPERILAHKVSRELTPEEIAQISGGRMDDTFSGPGLDRDDCGGPW